MDIRELRSFVKVAQCGGFSRAARELYVAQPALSRQIAKLEEQLGVELFTRHGKGVELTAAGARLVERAEVMLRYLEETADHVRSSAEEERGHLAVGLPPAIGSLVGPQLIQKFRQRWPKASLHALEGLSTSLQEWLLQGRIEVAVVYNQPLLEAFEVRPLFSERMVLVGPPGEASRSQRLSALGEVPLILPGLPHSNRRLVEQVAAQNTVRLNVILEVDSVGLTKKLVAAGQGYSILAHAAVQQDIDRGELVGHEIERPGIRSTVALARLKERRSSRLALSWEKIVLETLEELVTVGPWKEAAHWLGH
ncbi:MULTISPECIES: LysR family transcriptional regulator [Pseudomonas]|jgi:LysR family nitrogen assimilation transcriptional regulator|uniref:Transcriptional regulator n=1 Tax=Pseudomonas oryzihabitans TaxID=47885 RepID=A0A0U4XU20_9PSED|nr:MULTISPECIES: LysR substrate-binding domain-containing protein [Pseudomonas]ALZ84937.1 transcriptional regulator [Pseudomonas oryzihabitans]WCE09728.1 LysR substrate-binding domain-containing protein [Pseudomonas sp. JBR1]HAC69690.1 transcriptional regulator [Pseudomonas sp.]